MLLSPRHLLAVLLGAVLSALLVHYLGYVILAFLDLGIRVHSSDPSLKDSLPPKIVLKVDDRVPEPPMEVPEEVPEVEMPKEVPLDIPDLEDVPLEDVVIEPGKTSIALDSPSLSPPDDLMPGDFSIDAKAIAAGMPEPEAAQSLQPVPDSPLKLDIKEPDAIDPDEWYKDRLKGAGGVDDSHLPDGSKTLDQLMAQSDLGKDSGYSRLGADLLFEYDKAVMKNSARLSMIRLAALMMKNPETTFIVEGHTDSFGSEDYNAVLSLMRANAVRLWLKKNGISMKNAKGKCRLYIRACGASRPVVSVKGDRNAQASNRRVEIHMRKPGEEIPPRSLPDTYEVDMKTSISKQVRDGVGAKVKVTAGAASQPIEPVQPIKPTPPSVRPVQPVKPAPTPSNPAQSVPAKPQVKSPERIEPKSTQQTTTKKDVAPAQNLDKKQAPAPEPVKKQAPVAAPIPEAEPIVEEVPTAEPVEEHIPAAEPVDEIPAAEPVEEQIPTAEPVEEIPSAEPLEEAPYSELPADDIPEVVPVVRAFSGREGGLA